VESAKTAKTWNAAIVALAEGGGDQSRESFDDLLEVLSDYSPALTQHEGHLGARLWVQAPDVVAAAAIAVSVWTIAMDKVGIAGSAPVQVAVTSVAELAEQLNRPNFPALVGVSEVAELLAVSRARASELARSATGFPRPVAQLASGPVWLQVSVLEFLSGWSRRPGRPQRREAVSAAISHPSGAAREYDDTR
jgi:hypothetical protein